MKEHPSKLKGIQLQNRFRKEGMKAVVALYKQYRNEFCQFGQRYCSSKELVLESWHDAVLDFYEIVLAGKFDAKKSGVKTFLFTIGKYKLFTKLKKEHRNQIVILEKDSNFSLIDNWSNNQQEHSTEQAEQLQKALKKLGERCQQLLTLFYYHDYSVEAIIQNMGYKNKEVVYSHKSRCIRQLKELFEKSALIK